LFKRDIDGIENKINQWSSWSRYGIWYNQQVKAKRGM